MRQRYFSSASEDDGSNIVHYSPSFTGLGPEARWPNDLNALAIVGQDEGFGSLAGEGEFEYALHRLPGGPRLALDSGLGASDILIRSKRDVLIGEAATG